MSGKAETKSNLVSAEKVMKKSEFFSGETCFGHRIVSGFQGKFSAETGFGHFFQGFRAFRARFGRFGHLFQGFRPEISFGPKASFGHMTETLVSGMVSAETKCTGFGQNHFSGVSVVSAYCLLYVCSFTF